MITPYLEGLIHEGKAQYKTASLGGGRVLSIVVPDNRYCVITDVTFYPHQEYNGTFGPNDNYYIGIMQQIWIRSRLGNNFYIVRPLGLPYETKVGRIVISMQPIHFNTYLIHDSLIKITVQPKTSPAEWADIDLAILPDSSQEDGGKFGMGTTTVLPSLPVLRNFSTSGSPNYVTPPSLQRFQVAGKIGNSEYLDDAASASTQVDPLPGSTAGLFQPYNFPMMQIGYIEIQGKPKYMTT